MGLNEKFFKSAAGGITPSDHFNTVLYTGNNSTQAITGVGFAPDFTWIKQRSGGASHSLQDTVRGAGQSKNIYSDDTAAEGTYGQYGYLSAFGTDGFTVVKSSGNHTNTSSSTYVAWNWKAGGAAVQNNDGTIQGANCLVSANQDAGFSITKYTGNGTSGATFGHGLGQQVGISIVKNLGSSTYWYVYCNLLPTNNNLYLNTTDSKQADGVMLGGNSTTVSVSASSSVNTNSGSYIAYNFASVNGYQKIGTYQGDNSTNESNIINVGFQPSFVMIKNTTSGSTSWVIADDERGYADLYANDASAEFSSGSLYGAHFTSVGFTFATADISRNASNNTYIYLAIA